jgi:glycerate kinase
MLLWEIIKNVTPLPFEWLDDTHARFNSGDFNYGLIFETKVIKLPGEILSVTNIVFGTLHTDNGLFSINDLNLSLTNSGNIRTIFGTLAAAVVANKPKTNLVVIGAGDNVREKRSHLYSMVISDILSEFKEYSDIYDVTDSNGNKLCVMANKKLSNKTQIELAKLIGLDKLIEGPV